MDIQLANVLSDISGGERPGEHFCDSEKRARSLETGGSEHEMVKASRDEVTRRLEGNWRDDLLFELQQAGQANQLLGVFGGRRGA